MTTRPSQGALRPGDWDLTGRVALVTGASRGIGAAVAVRLASAGAAVAVTARTLDDEPGARLEGSLRRTARAVEAEGVAVLAVAADLADPEARASIVGSVEAELGPVDVLVNNAAAAIYAPVAEMPLRRRRLLFELNAHAPIDLAQAVLPGMRSRRAGWIVNVSSATSRHESGPPYAPSAMGATAVAYGASKAALERFTTGLAAEVFADGIAVNAIAPVAAVRTEGAAAHLGDLLDDGFYEPIDYLAEAIAYLSTCPVEECTGELLLSKPLLRRLGLLAPADDPLRP